jgi:hypothetical protein
MKSTVVKFGLYGLLTSAVIFLAALTFGKGLSMGTQEVLGYLSIIISLSFVFFGIKHFRDKENNGKVSFKKAFSIGLLISVFVGIGIGVVDFIYTAYINPDFVQEYLDAMVKTMEAELPPEEAAIEKAALEEQMANFGSSWFMALLMFSTVFIIGMIVSLLSSLLLQRK